MKKATLFLIVLFVSMGAFAQTDWKQIYSENGISISVREDNCKGKTGHTEHIFFVKVQNSNSQPRTVEWDYILTDNNGKCIGCNSETKENRRIIKIAGNQTIEAACDPGSRNDMKVVMNFLDIKLVREIKEVKVSNIAVKE